jgi:hypothetical protein
MNARTVIPAKDTAPVIPAKAAAPVIPAQAGIQGSRGTARRARSLDPRLRGDDGEGGVKMLHRDTGQSKPSHPTPSFPRRRESRAPQAQRAARALWIPASAGTTTTEA